jgi:hypothetical protein
MHSLVGQIGHDLIGPNLRGGWLSAPYVPFRRYLGLYQEAFETGTVLGYTYRNRMAEFAQLFSESGREMELVNFVQELAQKRLAEAPAATSFFELAMFAEEERVRAQWRHANTTLSELQLCRLEDKLKMPRDAAFNNLQVAAMTGIGLGSTYPEVTERLWRQEHERPVTQEEVDEARKYGLDIPAEIPPPVSLVQQEGRSRSVVELFVSKYRPELLACFKSMGR